MYAWCGRINDARITLERLKSSPLFNTLNEKSEWRSLTDLHKAGENTSFPLCLTRRLFPCEACCHGPTARCGPSAWANLKPTGRPQTWSLSPITSAETNPFYLAVAQKQKEKNLNVDIYWCYFSNESALMDAWLQWEMTRRSASRCRHYSLINDRVYSNYIHFITINNIWETLLFSCKYAVLRPHLSRT